MNQKPSNVAQCVPSFSAPVRSPDGITGKNYATPLPNNKIPFPISPAECRALPNGSDNRPTDADAADANAADVLTHSSSTHIGKVGSVGRTRNGRAEILEQMSPIPMIQNNLNITLFYSNKTVTKQRPCDHSYTAKVSMLTPLQFLCL